MSWNQNKIFKYLLVIPFLILIYFYDNGDKKERRKYQKELSIEYPLINKANKDYKGIVVSCTVGNKYMAGSDIYVKLSNDDKFVIYGTSHNSQYKNYDLRDNLNVNDSIYYNYKTNELYIYRGNEKLYYKLFERI